MLIRITNTVMDITVFGSTITLRMVFPVPVSHLETSLLVMRDGSLTSWVSSCGIWALDTFVRGTQHSPSGKTGVLDLESRNDTTHVK
jgi:hypothetical protein